MRQAHRTAAATMDGQEVSNQPAICTGLDVSIPFEKVIALARDAGFAVVGIGARPEHSGYATAEGRAAMRAILSRHGVRVDCVHAPFPDGDRLFSLDEGERRESVRQCEVAVEAAADLESSIVVIHLIQPYDIPHGEARDRMIDQGRRSVAALAARCEARGVKLALENGQRTDYDEVVTAFLMEFDTPAVGFCYDSGHENVQGACFRMLERFASRLLTLHLHDNSGWDSHVLPYEGTIEWSRLPGILRAADYRGPLLLEADIGNSAFPDPAQFLAEAMARVRRIATGG